MNSSARASRASAALARIARRAFGPVAAQPGKARAAASTARSTSARPPAGARVATSPVTGFRRSKSPWPLDCTSAPSISIVISMRALPRGRRPSPRHSTTLPRRLQSFSSGRPALATRSARAPRSGGAAPASAAARSVPRISESARSWLSAAVARCRSASGRPRSGERIAAAVARHRVAADQLVAAQVAQDRGDRRLVAPAAPAEDTGVIPGLSAISDSTANQPGAQVADAGVRA